RGERGADDDRRAVRRGQHEAAREPRLEVARDSEAREDAPEGRRLEDDEHELERGVAGREVELRHLADRRQPARERREEEQREYQRRDDQGGIAREAVDRPPGDRPRRRAEAGPAHVRTIRVRRAAVAASIPSTRIAVATPNPSASASPSQPLTSRERIASIRYETGL